MNKLNTANQFQPPFCAKHSRFMHLRIYMRPGSPPGNGWACEGCIEERKSIESGSLEHAPTRFPEGAEL